jgi:hypothetical protein
MDEMLSPTSVLAEATERTGGLDDLGEGPFLEGLERFGESLHRDARLNDVGVFVARERMLLHTVNRLGYVHDRAEDPAIAEQEIVAPVFIIGMPRTGTTILHDILAQDPATRAPLTWETMFPSPPPRAETFTTDPRIAACEATFPEDDEFRKRFQAIHPMGALLSQECVTMMGETMICPMFHNQFRVPGYQDWVDTTDLAPVYEFHHRQLQHLQAHCARERWVLKTGAHLWGLEHLLATYPDARIVFTHRDPVSSMTSYASLTNVVREVTSDEVDPHEIAADWTPRLRRTLHHGIDVREQGEHPDARFLDVRFRDFVQDQFSVVEAIYDAFDLEMTPEAAAAMRAFIDDNPPGKHGSHDYAPAEYGLDPAVVRADFARYIEHFDIAPEG